MTLSKLPKDHPLHDRQYVIITGQMLDFQDKVRYLLEQNLPGMIAYGVARIGKTTSIEAMVQVLKQDYRNEVAVKKTIVETHSKAQKKSFYREMCDNFNITVHNKAMTGSELRSLIVEHLIAAGRTHENRVLLIVDEASLMLDDDYHYLMDIYNRLEAVGVRLICVLVGTEVMAAKKKHMRDIKETQIIGRFMVNEFAFRPVTGVSEIKEVLNGFDEDIEYDGAPVTKDIFPESFKAGKQLSMEAQNIADAITTIKKDIIKTAGGRATKKNIADTIQMQYLIMAIELIMKEQGKYSKKEKWPDKEDWINALCKVGFREAIQWG